MLERIQKILSAQGIASRRKAEEYIVAGLVKVNGEVAKLGQKADADIDVIEVNGKVLEERSEMLYYVMNKPVGVETSNVVKPKPTKALPLEEKTVRDLLPKSLQGKVFPVGRLDKDSSGLLLFTSDGVLTYRLTHPKFQHEKEYEVTLDRPINSIAMKKLEEGFMLDGTMTKPLKVEKLPDARIRITLTEGRNRQIRRMCQNVGFTVKELKRIRIMTLEDNRLKPGMTRALTVEEKDALLHSISL